MATHTKETVLCTLKIPQKDVLNIYIYGSRLHSPAKVHQNTDYDLLIVMRTGALTANSTNSAQTTHRNNIDATLLSEDVFQSRIREGSILECCCLYLPPSHILLERSPPKVIVNSERVAYFVKDRYATDRAKAEKFLGKGNDKAARKTLHHAYRNFQLARQLMQHGRIVRFEWLADELDGKDVAQILMRCDETAQSM